MTDAEILTEIERRFAEPIYLIGFLPMTFEQAERFLFGEPWTTRDSDEIAAIPYWITNES